MTNPFPLVELAVRELVIADCRSPRTGSAATCPTSPVEPYYVWFGLIPGGSTNEIEGEWVLDIDVFDDDYTDAMNVALDLEAASDRPQARHERHESGQLLPERGPRRAPLG